MVVLEPPLLTFYVTVEPLQGNLHLLCNEYKISGGLDDLLFVENISLPTIMKRCTNYSQQSTLRGPCM